MSYPLSKITLKTLTKMKEIKLDKKEHDLLTNKKKHKLLKNFFETNIKKYKKYSPVKLSIKDFNPKGRDLAEIKDYSTGRFVDPNLKTKITGNRWTRIT